jgi:hypothetical protein
VHPNTSESTEPNVRRRRRWPDNPIGTISRSSVLPCRTQSSEERADPSDAHDLQEVTVRRRYERWRGALALREVTAGAAEAACRCALLTRSGGRPLSGNTSYSPLPKQRFPVQLASRGSEAPKRDVSLELPSLLGALTMQPRCHAPKRLPRGLVSFRPSVQAAEATWECQWHRRVRAARIQLLTAGPPKRGAAAGPTSRAERPGRPGGPPKPDVRQRPSNTLDFEP